MSRVSRTSPAAKSTAPKMISRGAGDVTSTQSSASPSARASDRSAHLAALVDRHLRAGQPRRRALHVDDGGQRYTVAARDPVVHILQDVSHSNPPCSNRASSSNDATE